jgi:hypothetical protein
MKYSVRFWKIRMKHVFELKNEEFRPFLAILGKVSSGQSCF